MPAAHFYRLVNRLCRSGERPVAEVLLEIGADFTIRSAIETKLERYVEALEWLGLDVLRGLGADRTRPLPLIKVPEGCEPPGKETGLRDGASLQAQ